jgi:hypothetical protein
MGSGAEAVSTTKPMIVLPLFFWACSGLVAKLKNKISAYKKNWVLQIPDVFLPTEIVRLNTVLGYVERPMII